MLRNCCTVARMAIVTTPARITKTNSSSVGSVAQATLSIVVRWLVLMTLGLGGSAASRGSCLDMTECAATSRLH